MANDPEEKQPSASSPTDPSAPKTPGAGESLHLHRLLLRCRLLRLRLLPSLPHRLLRLVQSRPLLRPALLLPGRRNHLLRLGPPLRLPRPKKAPSRWITIS